MVLGKKGQYICEGGFRQDNSNNIHLTSQSENLRSIPFTLGIVKLDGRKYIVRIQWQKENLEKIKNEIKLLGYDNFLNESKPIYEQMNDICEKSREHLKKLGGDMKDLLQKEDILGTIKQFENEFKYERDHYILIANEILEESKRVYQNISIFCTVISYVNKIMISSFEILRNIPMANV